MLAFIFSLTFFIPSSNHSLFLLLSYFHLLPIFLNIPFSFSLCIFASYYKHRHEPPVTAETPSIIYEDADIVVINKPASIPVRKKDKTPNR